jgi:hypothetical protein
MRLMQGSSKKVDFPFNFIIVYLILPLCIISVYSPNECEHITYKLKFRDNNNLLCNCAQSIGFDLNFITYSNLVLQINRTVATTVHRLKLFSFVWHAKYISRRRIFQIKVTDISENYVMLFTNNSL